MMCTEMVREEEDQVEKIIGGLPDNIQGNVIAAEPMRLQDDIRIANNLMDQKLKGYVVKNVENKIRKCNKVGHMTRDCMNVVAATATQRALVVNQKANKARRKAYVLGGREANTDSNVIICTFLLNNHYASMLFDSGDDRSFVSSTFGALLDVTPSTLDVSYAVNLADRRITEANTMLRGNRSDKEKKSKLSIISCTKTQKYIKKGYQTFLAQVTKKGTKDKSEEKRLEDVPIVWDFPEDLPGLPPT
nr:hypothetical protein [Tanacetum cinerariifolium]